MTSTRPLVRIGELVKVHHGWPFKSSECRPYDTQDIEDGPLVTSIGHFDYSGGFRGNKTSLRRYLGPYPAEYELNPGDILLVMTCQTEGGEILGVPAVVPDDGHVYLHNQRIGRVDLLDPDRLHADYFYHFARSEFFNRQLFVTASGSKILHTSPGRIEDTTMELPSLIEQRAIAEVLGALDDKIAANDRLATTADDLFATHFEKAATPGREVPLSSLARFVNGKAFTKGASGTGRVVIRIAELNSGVGASTVYNDIEVADDHLARPGDLLFAWSGSLTVKRWFRSEAIINQHIFKVVPTVAPMWVVKGALDRKLLDFRAIAADKATTMGHIQRRHLDEPVRVPPVETISAMDAVMTGLWNRALSAEVESLQLIELRDTLLPALMSGRLSVKDAENTVSEVV